MAEGYEWRPITDLSETDLALASTELPALFDVWQGERDRLGDLASLQRFNQELRREWAIETGILERLYSLDRGVTQLLIEQGIDASLIPHDATDKPPEVVANIIRDQEAAVEWLFDFVGARRALTISFIKELHALITRNQHTTTAIDQFGQQFEVPLIHGEFKTEPNNPTRPDGSVHEYCPPGHVSSEMDNLVAWHAQHLASGAPPEVESAWLHHRFTQIHPFQDGNGRVARALGTLALIRAGWFPLVVTRDDRVPYIAGLEAADTEDLQPLVDLFARLEKRAFVQALGIAREVVREGERIDQVLGAIEDMFRRREAEHRRELGLAKETARRVWEAGVDTFEKMAERLRPIIERGQDGRRVFVDAAGPDDERRTWHRWQVLQVASKLEYFAGLTEFSCWCRLCIDTEGGRGEVLLSLHSIGRDYSGVLGANMAFYRRQGDDTGARHAVDLTPVADEVFQLNYRDDPDAVLARFRPWVEQGLARGLDQWRRGE